MRRVLRWYDGGMAILLIFFIALGAVCGSFAGVIAERLHTGQSWVSGRSRCNSCARTLDHRDLVPVLSWLVSLGRCRTCGSGVPWRYAVVEAVLGALFALSYLVIGLTYTLPFLLFAIVVLTVIVLYDVRHTVIPPHASSLLFATCFAFALLHTPTVQALGGALMTAGMLALLFVALHVFSGGRAMGLGDAPLVLSLSLLAAPIALTGLVFSFWVGALCGILILVKRRGGPKMNSEVPFAPFLACGYLLALFTGWNLFPL